MTTDTVSWCGLLRDSCAGRASVEEGGRVLAIEVRDNESIDSALRRFKRELHDNGVLEALKRHERYEKPSDKRRRMLAAAIRRSRRAARRRGE
jgi:small subunit ribosomal protein S21